jgi:hypothetical protein
MMELPSFSVTGVGLFNRNYPNVGHAMAQVVSNWPVTAEAQIRAQANPYAIYGRHSDTGKCFSLIYSAFLCQYHSTMALHTYISPGG